MKEKTASLLAVLIVTLSKEPIAKKNFNMRSNLYLAVISVPNNELKSCNDK